MTYISIFTSSLLALASCIVPSWAEELELEQAIKLGAPYCVDMRNSFERDRSSRSTSTASLTRLFGCRKTYVLPLSVKPDQQMLKRYKAKFKTFKGHQLLIWCTHGVRTGLVQTSLQNSDVKVHSVKGGTLYLADVLKLAK